MDVVQYFLCQEKFLFKKGAPKLDQKIIFGSTAAVRKNVTGQLKTPITS